ncbi:MAG TPA: hypothetical protein VES19_16160 [Candidatus Limnocylindrales bacterium]|nr:hypothetical protein [Candidatus Limnocylindrales bacterium]
MTVRRGTLYLGVFLLAAGAVTLGVATGLLDRTAVADATAMLWPVALIAIGAGLVLRRSPAALVAGIIAAALPGLALAASVVAVPEALGPCTDVLPIPARAETRSGSFGSSAAVDLELSCGELNVNTGPGTGWSLTSRDGEGRRTTEVVDGSRLSVDTDRGTRRWGLATGQVEWDAVLPTGTTLDLATELNAGRAGLGLAGSRLGVLDLEINAGSLTADLAGASLDRLAVEVNAGSVGIVLPADSFSGSLTANAGSLALCAPDQLALRVRSSAALGSIDVDGLSRRGSAWETPGYDTAPFKADLAIAANVGSVTINPEGGCK